MRELLIRTEKRVHELLSFLDGGGIMEPSFNTVVRMDLVMEEGHDFIHEARALAVALWAFDMGQAKEITIPTVKVVLNHGGRSITLLPKHNVLLYTDISGNTTIEEIVDGGMGSAICNSNKIYFE